jgi:deoxycytidylate deaminase
MPYRDPELEYLYVDLDHPCMSAAKAQAERSTCYKQRTGAVITDLDPAASWQPEHWIVAGGNNSVQTPQDACPRQNMETGTGYHLCFDQCGGNLHAEVAAIEDLEERLYPHYGHRLMLFLYGHWWCCEDCCAKMKAAGVTTVVLLEGSGPETRWF